MQTPGAPALAAKDQRNTPDNVPIARRTLVSYGSFALPLSLAEIPILLYLPAFYSKEVGLSPGLVGLAFLFARLWDGLADLLTGWLSDRSSFRLGRRKPWVVLGAPFLMITTWFLCNPSGDVGVFYLMACAALFYAADAVVKIPYLSWGSELATDYTERSRVTAFRETFLMFGNLTFVAVPLLLLSPSAPLGDILFVLSTVTLILVPLTIVPLALFVKDSVQHPGGAGPLLAGLISLTKHRVFSVFAVAMLFFFIAEGVINSLAVFSFGVGLQLQDKLLWVVLILYISTLAAVPITVRLFQRREKHRLCAVAIFIVACAYCAHIVVPTGDFPLVIALWAIAGLGNAAALILPTSILADIIDHGELLEGRRRAGAYMAVFNLVKKLGLALGVGLSFALLEIVGYEPSAARHSASDVTNIRLMGFVLPALLLVPASILIWRHPITRKAHQKLRMEIDARGVETAGRAVS